MRKVVFVLSLGLLALPATVLLRAAADMPDWAYAIPAPPPAGAAARRRARTRRRKKSPAAI